MADGGDRRVEQLERTAAMDQAAEEPTGGDSSTDSDDDGDGDGDDELFDFVAWLEAGVTDEPARGPAAPDVGGDEPAAEGEAEAETGATGESDGADEATPGPSLPSPPSVDVHPAKAATFALFLAVVAMAALTASGALPALGPAVGLAG